MTDKELLRRFKAETVGRLVVSGILLAGVWFADGQDCDTVKVDVSNNMIEKTDVQNLYTDSVRNVNAIKFDAVKSRTK